MLSACGVAAQAAGLIERGLCFGDEQPSIVSSAAFCGDSDSTPALIPRRDLLAYRSVPPYARGASARDRLIRQVPRPRSRLVVRPWPECARSTRLGDSAAWPLRRR